MEFLKKKGKINNIYKNVLYNKPWYVKNKNVKKVVFVGIFFIIQN